MTFDALLLALFVALAGVAFAAATRAALRARTLASRRRRVALAAFLGVLFAVSAWARFIEPEWVVRTTTRVHWPGPPLRVVVIGDLHAGRIGPSIVTRAVRLANDADPDLVLLAGDYITGYEGSTDKLDILAALRPLRAKRGVFAVLGNHDSEPYATATPRAETLSRFLQGMGFTVLRNAWVEAAPGVVLVGIDEVRSGNADPVRAFAGAPVSGARIVMTHDWHGLGLSGMQRFDLAVTGHTHGGQVCVPFAGGARSPGRTSPSSQGSTHGPRGATSS